MRKFAKTLRTVDDLVRDGFIAPNAADHLRAVTERYALAITPDMAALIDGAEASDPISKQFLPDVRELTVTPDERADPIGDARHEVLPGVVHRYPDRVLFKLTHACPVYCRFCFRREQVGPGGATMLVGDTLDRAIAYVAENPKIFEVILTGGDPLMLAPARIRALTERLAALPHVGSLRWHTRVPVVEPGRVTVELVDALRAGGAHQAVYLGVHTNHVRELTADARRAISLLIDGGVVVLSQTVLLRNVNADADSLEALFRALVSMRVRPYYLHHPDLAPGTGHFRLSIPEGQAIVAELKRRLTGLAMPTYVLDIPGGYAKVPIGPRYLNGNQISDPSGKLHSLSEQAGE